MQRLFVHNVWNYFLSTRKDFVWIFPLSLPSFFVCFWRKFTTEIRLFLCLKKVWKFNFIVNRTAWENSEVGLQKVQRERVDAESFTSTDSRRVIRYDTPFPHPSLLPLQFSSRALSSTYFTPSSHIVCLLFSFFPPFWWPLTTRPWWSSRSTLNTVNTYMTFVETIMRCVFVYFYL